MPISNPPLWHRISSHVLPFRQRDGQSDQRITCRSFADTLRNESTWTAASATAIEAEYRRFMYLKALDGDILTPPACVDEAWHLHMDLGDDYAATFLPNVLGRAVTHHSGLSPAESRAAYLRCRALYEQEFGSPPRDIWPTKAQMDRAHRLRHVFVWGPGVFFITLPFPILMKSYGAPDWSVILVSVLTFGGFFATLAASIALTRLEPQRIAQCG